MQYPLRRTSQTTLTSLDLCALSIEVVTVRALAVRCEREVTMTESTTTPPPPPPKDAEDAPAAATEKADNGQADEAQDEEEDEDVAMPTAVAATAVSAAPTPATVAAVAVAAPAQTGGGKRSPSDFLKTVLGRSVVVKLNSGIDYRGVLSCLDGYMNIAMEQAEEYVNGQLKAKYGDCFIRGNNVLYISTQRRR